MRADHSLYEAARRRHLMRRRGAGTSPTFCSLIAHSWTDLAVCDTQTACCQQEEQ